MPAAVTLSRPDVFPKGTIVKLYALPKPEPAELTSQVGDPATWANKPEQVATSTVAASGSLSFAAGLTAGGQYLAYALVGGKDRYLRVMVPSNTGGALSEPFSASLTGVGATVGNGFTPPAGRRCVITSISASIISTGAVAAASVVDVLVKSGATTIQQLELQSAKTAAAGEGVDRIAKAANLACGIGEEARIEAVAPANARVNVSIEGYIE